LITNLIQNQMLANIKENYLIEYIDQPYVAETRIYPKRTFIVLISTILSFFLIIFIMVFYRFGFANPDETQAAE